jgi:DNA repair exonuclease SbcCD ATPase subunit
MTRAPKADDYGQVRGTIDSLRARAPRLEEDHATALTALQTELARTPQDYDERAVRDARREVAGIEIAQSELAERIAALETRLPTDAARADAEAQARAAAEEAAALRDRFAAAWARLWEALNVAEAAAREVNSLRDASRAPIIRVEDLDARFGLDVPVPLRPQPERHEAQAVAAVGLFISETGYEGPRDIVVRELNKARARAQKVET